MGDPREGAELTLISGDACLARLRAHPQPLSMETLQGVWDGLEQCGELGEELGSCLDLALERFCQEPLYVQENARMLICWDEGELEFIAGQGQCEVSVSCSAGEPQYHITEKTWDVFVAWMNSHPEPLSIKNLQRIRNTLESWGALGEELSGCFGEAISQFSREPPCVQENARLRLCWDRGSLEFLSGQGQFTFSVSYQEGNPHYHFHVETLPVHLYVARLRSRNDPLSADSLLNVYTELGLCQGDTAALRACFYRAQRRFRREPRCMQENARLQIRWDGQELEFVSGQGQCEISVLLADGEPQYHITALGGDRPVTWSHTSPEPLSVTDLARVRDRLGRWGALGKGLSGCFGEAISQFSREPRCVQENARLLIRWGGGELEFISGQGQCEMSVLLADGRPQYHITELGGDKPVTWSHTSPELLSIADLARVRDRLVRWGALNKGLSSCFGKAISQFSQEPRCVQENARLLIRWGRGELEFISGWGQCEISVLLDNGEPQYHITELGGDRPVTWSHTSPEPLSVTDLVRVRDRLGRWGALGEELSSCFGEAISQFCQEPQCVQENARMRIRWDGQELEFVSGQGQCEISVLLADGEPQYHITALGGDRPVTWSHSSPEPLSVADLERVRDRLERWGKLGEGLSSCFAEAISQFSREPPWVQENARMRLCWDGGSLEFLSGQGQYTFSVSYQEGNPRYRFHVETHPVHLYVTRLRSRKDPLTAHSLFKYYTELGLCRGDTAALRACLHRAWRRFRQEPRCVQENARLLIQWGRGELKFISGRGENLITVCESEEGRIQYRVQVSGWWPRIARLLIFWKVLGRD